MATVLNFLPTDVVTLGKQLRDARVVEQLTLSQAATALGISPITLDAWEQGRKPQISVADATSRYKKYRVDTNFCRKSGNNLLFGVFPIRIAREILGVSLDEMAVKLEYSTSSWSKMEANARIVPAEKISEIESLVGDAWNAACGGRENIFL